MYLLLLVTVSTTCIYVLTVVGYSKYKLYLQPLMAPIDVSYEASINK